MRLFFRTYGDGPPLILLHGLFGASDNWVHIARALENCFTVYLPDMRNHGRSPWSPVHTYEAMADDIIDLAASLKAGRYFIGGHSMGGKVAMYCGVKRPQEIAGLFVGDISPFSYPVEGETIEQQLSIISTMMNVDPSRFADRRELEDHLTSLAGEKSTRLILSKNIAFEAGKLRWRLNISALYANLDNMRNGFPRPPASVTGFDDFPVIFLKGSESPYISERDLIDIRKLFPGAQLRIAEGAGHWVHTEKADDVISALKDLKVLSSGEGCD